MATLAKGFSKALGESLVPVYAGKGALYGNSICTVAGAVIATILSQWLWQVDSRCIVIELRPLRHSLVIFCGYCDGIKPGLDLWDRQ